MFKTEQEIFSQYEALRKTCARLLQQEAELRKLAATGPGRGLTFIGCGSSYSLCKSAALSARLRLNVPAHAIASGDLLLNFSQYRGLIKDTVLVAPSRSGSTSEVVLAVQRARKELGLRCISVCTRENSELGALADLRIEIPWAFDASVCQTRTVTNLYAANLLLIGLMAGDKGLVQETGAAIEAGDSYMKQHRGVLQEIANNASWEKVVVLADAELEGIAEEGALAFNEICQLPSSYHHVLDIRHGPMVLVNPKTLAILACSPDDESYQRDLVRDVKRRGAMVVTVSSKPKETWGSDCNVAVPAYKNFAVTGLPFIFVPQALSYFKARARGVNPDEPQGLDPWIKL